MIRHENTLEELPIPFHWTRIDNWIKMSFGCKTVN